MKKKQDTTLSDYKDKAWCILHEIHDLSKKRDEIQKQINLLEYDKHVIQEKINKLSEPISPLIEAGIKCQD
jgi:peptidoglycan hydrolase CwlO-like protein